MGLCHRTRLFVERFLSCVCSGYRVGDRWDYLIDLESNWRVFPLGELYSMKNFTRPQYNTKTFRMVGEKGSQNLRTNTGPSNSSALRDFPNMKEHN